MGKSGYYSYPTIYNEEIAFASENDLWLLNLNNTIARRLTNSKGVVSLPSFSGDGKWIAFSNTEEGHNEIYLIPSDGGRVRRLTYLGGNAFVIGWIGSSKVIFSSSSKQAFDSVNIIYTVDIHDETIEEVKIGPANFISFNPDSITKIVLQRHGKREYSFWKRYRGGTAGQLWIDKDGKGVFNKLIDLQSDLYRPLWIKDRIYFTSDHDGVGNIYSCLESGKDLRKETNHKDFYVRNQSTDGKSIVYHLGGDLFMFDPKIGCSEKVDVKYYSPCAYKNRKFILARNYISDYNLHPLGHHLAITTRGKSFCFSNWEGPVLQLGKENKGRYKFVKWLYEGNHVIVVNDILGKNVLEIYDIDNLKLVNSFKDIDLGYICNLQVSPKSNEVILSNHKNELIYVNLKTKDFKVIDRSKYSIIEGMSWSPDGKFVAYNCSLTRHVSIIKVVNLKENSIYEITKPILKDISPSFDPEGKYLYFLSYRQFDPSWDTLHFDMCFPLGMKPYVITLRKDLKLPFLRTPKNIDVKLDKKNEKEEGKKELRDIKIDFDGIQNRIFALPFKSGIYSHIFGLKNKVLLLNWRVRGLLNDDCKKHADGGDLEVYDFLDKKIEKVAEDVVDVSLSVDCERFIYRDNENDLRVLKVGEKVEDDLDVSPDKRGWIDLKRVKVDIDPSTEWQQMFEEAWRLQRDHFFWTNEMPKDHWERIYNIYQPLLKKVNSREELNDLLWEMQGELGTSHAYVFGGDLFSPSQYTIGNLGAEFCYDDKKNGYIVTRVLSGDSWEEDASSPFMRPGINLKEGDIVFEVAGMEVSKENSPEKLLINQANQEVKIVIGNSKGKNKRSIIVKTLETDTFVRYRDWVEKNREYVHKKTKDAVGYIHIPDMSAWGFSEFHRYFLFECERNGLIIDIRFNRGGSVSSLILEKLARKRLGYDLTRWFGNIPYPEDSPEGPMVCLINEYAGSDGDIFAYGFKKLKLGPLIGKRTWGGVVGIWPRHVLVDKGVTTQPEFSFWSTDPRYKIENYGVDPDIEVEIYPKDYVDNKDPQLDSGIKEIMDILSRHKSTKPKTC